MGLSQGLDADAPQCRMSVKVNQPNVAAEYWQLVVDGEREQEVRKRRPNKRQRRTLRAHQNYGGEPSELEHRAYSRQFFAKWDWRQEI